MNIAVLSGKGGTGKTLVSVNLAAAAKSATYIDCDVEEPNGHLFIKPRMVEKKDVLIKMPIVDEDMCNGCRKCVDFCKFNALALIMDKVIVFEDICHSCGGCVLICPEKALYEKRKKIGEIQSGKFENIDIKTGILNIGEASGVPIINELLKEVKDDNKLTLIDCPPGSACVVMESIKDADYCVLVAEPTIFGLENFKMVHELVTLFKKPHSVVINKCISGENLVQDYCKKNSIKILGEIPFDQELGTINSNAFIAVKESKKYEALFSELLQDLMKEAEDETITHS